jgi:bacteriorhodopsin
MSVEYSTNLSIFLQIISGVIAFKGLFVSLEAKHQILKEILRVELIVQVIELAFYLLFLQPAANIVTGMATLRYFDWFITTPTMLLTVIVYFRYEEEIEKNGVFNLKQFFQNNRTDIFHIFLFNLIMLVFGYLGEIDVISRTTATLWGFLAFFGSFQIIYKNYAQSTLAGRNLYSILFTIWALYGIIYLFPDVPKNNMYNMIDLVAKNFFGIFLFFKIKQVAKENRN